MIDNNTVKILVGHSGPIELAFGIHAIQYVHLMRKSNPKFYLHLGLHSALARSFFWPYSESIRVHSFFREQDFKMPVQFPLESPAVAYSKILSYFGGIQASIQFPENHAGIAAKRLFHQRESGFSGAGILIFQNASYPDRSNRFTDERFWLEFCRHYGETNIIIFPRDAYPIDLYFEPNTLPVCASDTPLLNVWDWIPRILMARLVIGHEGFYTHLAAWLGVPTLILANRKRSSLGLKELPFRQSRFAIHESDSDTLGIQEVIHAVDQLERSQLSEL